jgi:hypothetical protein
MCGLYAKTDDRLTLQYLNEAVMEPTARVKVNKLGFCAYHTKKLNGGENKLGFALQLSSRAFHLNSAHIGAIDNVKAAKKQAATLKEAHCSCAVCETADEIMTRYAYTVAQMFDNEPEFASLFKNNNGFCMPQYILLLENAYKAGKGAKDYLSALSSSQKKSLDKTYNDLYRFTQSYDYANPEKGAKDLAKALPDAIKKLMGTKL